MAALDDELGRLDLLSNYPKAFVGEFTVVCRLEQHRLAHGGYPTSLADLEKPP